MSWVLSDVWMQLALLVAARVVAHTTLHTTGSLRLIVDCAFFGALTSLLIWNGIPPYSIENQETAFVSRLVHAGLKIVWWFAGAMVLANCARVFLILEHKPREGRLLQDIVVAIVYITAGLCIIAYVFSVPVGTVIATSGVFAIVLGLALQSTLNDVFSGIALNLNRLLSVGDWVVLDRDVQGRVVETNWRSTQFLNKTGDLVVVPNSILAKSRVTNLSVPDMSHGASLLVKIQASVPPRVVEETMQLVLLGSREILSSPSPSVSITGLTRDSIEVELSFRVPTLLSVAKAKNELFDLVYRHTFAAGLPIASDIADDSKAIGAGTRDTVSCLIGIAPIFANLTPDERDALGSAAERVLMKQGTLIVQKGSTASSLMIVAHGVAIVEDGSGDERIEFAKLSPGDVFGERGVLLGSTEIADTKCLTDVVFYQIAASKIAAILKERPAIAEDLAALLSKRIKAEDAFHEASDHHEPAASPDLRVRILRLLHL